MFHLTLAKILLLFRHYKYAIIFPIAVAEGPMVSVISGFLSSVGELNWLLVFMVLMLGDIVGDSIYYCLGRWRRSQTDLWLIKRLGLTEDRAQKFEKSFTQRDWQLLLFGKTQALGSVILFSAGVAKMPYKKFVFYNFVGSVPKIALLEAVGFYLGEGFFKADAYLNYVGLGSFVIALVLFAFYWLFKYYVRSNHPELEK